MMIRHTLGQIQIQHPDPLIGKGQILRIIDVFLLGPSMIYAGITGKVPEWLRLPSLVGGILTIAINYSNYQRLLKYESIDPWGKIPRL